MFEQRTFKDIVAFKWNQGEILAFHARNLEVAEISSETWESLKLTHSPNSEAANELQSWEQEINADVSSEVMEYGIRSLTLNVTQICNLKCTYCAAGGDGTYGSPQTKINIEKTLPQLKFFIEKVPDGGQFRITFLGGEPLLYPEGIQEIGNYVRLMTEERGIRAHFSLVTNGTLINEKTLSVIQQLRAKVTVSLDGPEQINDRVRPARDGQQKTSIIAEGLHKLCEIKNLLGGPLGIHGVFNKENLDLLSAYKFYRTFDVDRYDFTYSVSEKDDVANRRFIDEFNEVARLAFTTGGEKELRKIGIFDQYFNALDKQQRTENHCGAGKSYLMVDAKNDIYTCPWDVGQKEEKVGSGTELLQDRLADYQKSLVEKNNCQTCWARFLCGGGCMYVHKQSSGHKHIKDDQFCTRTRNLIATALFYYKQCRDIC